MPKKAKKKKKRVIKKQKKIKETNKGDVINDAVDPNEPLRFNVVQSIKNHKKVDPKDVFEN